MLCRDATQQKNAEILGPDGAKFSYKNKFQLLFEISD